MKEEYKIENLKLKKFERLVILSALPNLNGKRRVLAICECGNKKEFFLKNVLCGASKSCGCLSIELKTKHGFYKHTLYSVWEGMIRRCYKKNHIQFMRYGGRGVIVCKEWRNSPENFINWALKNGWEQGLQLDKDKLSPNRSGNLYCPEYCCFVTIKENSMYKNNSHLIEYNGEKLCVSQWADKYNIKQSVVLKRIKLGWDMYNVLNTPIPERYKKVA